jgi:hypothetical protein
LWASHRDFPEHFLSYQSIQHCGIQARRSHGWTLALHSLARLIVATLHLEACLTCKLACLSIEGTSVEHVHGQHRWYPQTFFVITESISVLLDHVFPILIFTHAEVEAVQETICKGVVDVFVQPANHTCGIWARRLQHSQIHAIQIVHMHSSKFLVREESSKVSDVENTLRVVTPNCVSLSGARQVQRLLPEHTTRSKHLTSSRLSCFVTSCWACMVAWTRPRHLMSRTRTTAKQARQSWHGLKLA